MPLQSYSTYNHTVNIRHNTMTDQQKFSDAANNAVSRSHAEAVARSKAEAVARSKADAVDMLPRQ
jgi:hypothetical protein